MNALLELITLVPKSMQVVVASMVIGGAGFYGHESRYMTVGDFTKSYVLDLKRTIREIQNELDQTSDPEIQRFLRQQLNELIDELCYEQPDDAYCQ
ncbi:unnamed protein product [marine sediment metagenome]|uniref:Uncharacterized protein n=1 Tax=marine sediment metagenome TaxID=412755 RepID=X0T414_9ZZZZ